MSNRLKNIVQQIKKYAAQPIPDDPGPAVAGKSLPSTYTGGVSYSNKNIKDMQTAIKSLAAKISDIFSVKNLQYAQLTNRDPGTVNLNQPTGPLDTTLTEEQEKSMRGQEAFGRFMINHYTSKSPIQGKQFNVDPAHPSNKNTTSVSNPNAIIDTLNRIGSSKNDFIVDGNWGPKTNNALKNVASMAFSAFNLGKDLGMATQGVDTGAINNLMKLIPPDDNSIPNDAKQKAPEITKILNSVSSLFDTFKDDVMNNPAYSDLISGEKPLLSTNKKDQIFAAPEDYVPSNDKYAIDVDGVGKLLLSEADILNKQSFDNWINSYPKLVSFKNSPASKSNPIYWPTFVNRNILQPFSAIINQKMSQK
jgi:hypothetical protein